MTDTRPLSQRLQDMAGEVVMVSPDLHRRLCRASLDAFRLEQAQDERMRPIGAVIVPIVTRAVGVGGAAQ